MANKQIEISAKIALDTKEAISSIQKAGKAFNQAFAKSGQTKFFEEFKKISPVIKEIDKEFNKLLKGMARTDATKELANMNKALKEQTEHIKNNIARYDELTKKINDSSSAAEKAAYRKEQRAVNEDSRRSMGKMEGLQERKESAQATLGKGPIDYMKLATAIAVAGRVAGGLMTAFGGQNFRNISHQASKDAFTNQYLSDVTGGGLSYGLTKAAKDKNGVSNFDRAMQAADQKSFWEIAKRPTVAAADVTAAGLAAGSMSLNPLAAPAAMAAAAAGHLADPVNQDLLSEIGGRQHYQSDEIYAKNRLEAYNNVKSRTEFLNSKLDERSGGARGRMAAFEAQGSAGRGNINRGRGLGFDEGEINAAMSIMGQSGALGGERQNASSLFGFQRRGLANMGESGNMLAGTVGVMSNQQRTAAVFEKAVERGSKKGLETSIVKDLVGATIEIAKSTGQRVSEIDTFQNLMESALGAKTGMQTGRADIEGAKNVVQRYVSERQGGGNAVGIAIRNLGVASVMKDLGVGGLSSTEQMSYAQAGSFSELSTMQKERMWINSNPKDPNDQKAKAAFFKKAEGKFNLQAESNAITGAYTGLGTELEALGDPEALAKYRSDLKKNDPDALAMKERIASQIHSVRGGSRSEAEQEGEMIAAGTLAPGKVKNAKTGKMENASTGQMDVTMKTVDRMLAQVDSGAKTARDQFIGQQASLTLLRDGVKETQKQWALLASGKVPLVKNMTEGGGGLAISMGTLEDAIKDNTAALRHQPTPVKTDRAQAQAAEAASGEHAGKQPTKAQEYARIKMQQELDGTAPLITEIEAPQTSTPSKYDTWNKPQ